MFFEVGLCVDCVSYLPQVSSSQRTLFGEVGRNTHGGEQVLRAWTKEE